MRLKNIDALRGVASLSVVLYHAIGGFESYLANPTILTTIPAFGFAGVYLFFVISGFCIHLRWTKGRPVEFLPFWKRRIVRLYPAYLACLALFIWWNGFTSVKDLILHLTMLHNWSPESVYSINGVLWTLAIEEQLYLLYFLLLKMRVKLGWPVTLTILFFLRFAFFPVSYYFNIPFGESAISNWFIWALGSVAVEGYHGKLTIPKVSSILFLVPAAILHYFSYKGKMYQWANMLFEPYLWGVGSFFLLNFAMRLEGVRHWAVSLFAFIGLFSYSLYLTHLIVPVWFALPFAYLFFLAFERPAINYLSKV